jgi:hypothetical protein
MHLGGVAAHPTGTGRCSRLATLLSAWATGSRTSGSRDRGSNFTASFDAVFQARDQILRAAVQAPRMSAICDRGVPELCRCS